MDLFMVELMVADWAASLAWYRDHLGLTVERLDEPNRYALLAAGGKVGSPVTASLLLLGH